jgi:hypothetical protein
VRERAPSAGFSSIGRGVSFLRNLLGPRNPTLGWTRDPSRSIELDLDSDSLSGVPLDSEFDCLEFLGPARRSTASQGLWEFSPIGVVVEVHAAHIVGYLVVPIPDEHFGVEPYTGEVAIEGRRVPIAWIGRERDVTQAFGKPTRRDEDIDETVLFYEIGNVERQIELTPDGRIKTIAIFSYP